MALSLTSLLSFYFLDGLSAMLWDLSSFGDFDKLEIAKEWLHAACTLVADLMNGLEFVFYADKLLALFDLGLFTSFDYSLLTEVV